MNQYAVSEKKFGGISLKRIWKRIHIHLKPHKWIISCFSPN